MTIDVNHAALHTATVELKMITVNQRQMTLSVFRQIPEKQLIDGALKLNGVPWGWVNYFWPDVDIPFEAKSQAIQMLWQKDQTLYRSVIVSMPHNLESNLHWLDDSRWRKFIPKAIRDAHKSWEEAVRKANVAWHKKHPHQSRLHSPQNKITAAETRSQKAFSKKVGEYQQVFKDLSAMDQLFIAVGGGRR
jgi:hypothetical protein